MGYQNTFKALSDKTRREILDLLKAGEMTAGDISAKFNMTQATVSHHLSILKDALLVRDRKVGKFIYYELNLSVVEEVMSWLISLKGDGSDEK